MNQNTGSGQISGALPLRSGRAWLIERKEDGSVSAPLTSKPCFEEKIRSNGILKKIQGIDRSTSGNVNKQIAPTSDLYLLQAALHQLSCHSDLAGQKIRLTVKNAHIKVEGKVDWEFQRILTEKSLTALPAVKRITNLIKVRSVTRINESEIYRKTEVLFYSRNSAISSSRSPMTTGIPLLSL